MTTKPTELSPEQWRILGSNGSITRYKCCTLDTQRIYDWAVAGFIGFCAGILTVVMIHEILKNAI